MAKELTANEQELICVPRYLLHTWQVDDGQPLEDIKRDWLDQQSQTVWWRRLLNWMGWR
jgi:hypothetical protein